MYMWEIRGIEYIDNMATLSKIISHHMLIINAQNIPEIAGQSHGTNPVNCELKLLPLPGWK